MALSSFHFGNLGGSNPLLALSKGRELFKKSLGLCSGVQESFSPFFV